VTTHVVPADNPVWTARTWARVREEIDAGRRAYVVCPRISADAADEDADLVDAPPPTLDEPERPALSAVTDVAERLATTPALAGVGIGVLHGRLPSAQKEDVMAAFAAGRTPLLVSTTVIEVGVDVPEASVMVVLDAERFGLSQLHQLRGRVGRGGHAGLCLLVSRAPEGTDAAVRLETLARTNDGFALATADLELRREGDVLGASQSGRGSSLRLLRVVRDADLIATARPDAVSLVEGDPTLAAWPELVAAIDAWLEPEAQEYLERS
jgi:ATP-dependent DNA helicase RecG